MKYFWYYIFPFWFVVVGCDHYSSVFDSKQRLGIEVDEGLIECDVNISVSEFNYIYNAAVSIKNNSSVAVSIHQIGIDWLDDHNKSYTGNANHFANVVFDRQFHEPSQREELPINLPSSQEVTFFIDFTELYGSAIYNNKTSTKHSAYIAILLEINGCLYDKTVIFDENACGFDASVFH